MTSGCTAFKVITVVTELGYMNYKRLQSVLFRVKKDHVHVSCVYSLKVLKACSKLFPAAILNLIEIRNAGN